ncbi:D-alanyl-D-alanine carboxypeptidase/D-alanyl-D-alanine-endopeptidase [Paraflavitalea sp. CAU 1676]|uniref:D-alanyl-D-alanine carboxypeptidase/D-alanyl-D-alanine endopeptidase n=1 Tax=Paraflavitalea sp. CAU 1676 TaxID=3032598 RepID=UPI0023D9CC0D|nr:D-alanyl-D-alanine carboxypeptidase/D-alanyl-D-alanine-endopeptidase [Paraflavitalea sp. CAU 1676]MDF2190743.1 D-alanyl-D-alanine carboxypeptidase/D-alanyl-D-alanine-endopeptidase [Paraflavitalea sp. CAU 1676]
MKKNSRFIVGPLLFLAACSTQKAINKQAHQTILQDATISKAHIGISLYDVAENKYLYNHQADKYFVPASNTKIVTCFAALKYLGDSLTGIRYYENDTAVFILPAGDPTFLHPEFKKQPVVDFLQKSPKNLYITDADWKARALGSGWSWNDYNENYMAERSALPVFGNIIKWVQEAGEATQNADPLFAPSPSIYSIPEVEWKVRFSGDTANKSFYVERDQADNVYHINQGVEKKKEQEVPFYTNGIQSAIELLPDTLHKEVVAKNWRATRSLQPMLRSMQPSVIHSQPTDSMLRPMMHRSDNFYAEQTLLMVSNRKLGIMSDRQIIDTLLKTDLADLPQAPRWVDGSGLSRYNLFTPQDFVAILNKMRTQFGMDRIKGIFPTGGTGTLSAYYKKDSGYIYAKTGSLSGVLALSGFLYTQKNKLLVFSVLVNNHNGSPANIRRSVEAFLTNIRNKY